MAIWIAGKNTLTDGIFDGWNELIKVGMKNPTVDATPAKLRLNGLAGLEGPVEYDQAE